MTRSFSQRNIFIDAFSITIRHWQDFTRSCYSYSVTPVDKLSTSQPVWVTSGRREQKQVIWRIEELARIKNVLDAMSLIGSSRWSRLSWWGEMGSHSHSPWKNVHFVSTSFHRLFFLFLFFFISYCRLFGSFCSSSLFNYSLYTNHLLFYFLKEKLLVTSWTQTHIISTWAPKKVFPTTPFPAKLWNLPFIPKYLNQNFTSRWHLTNAKRTAYLRKHLSQHKLSPNPFSLFWI